MRIRMGMVVAVLFLIPFVHAQTERVRFSGTIVDSAGAPVAGARVSLSGPESRVAVTDDRGTFLFSPLARGTYALRVERAGFATITQTLTLEADQTLRLTLPSAAPPLVPVQVPRDAIRPADSGTGRGGGVPGGVPGGVVGGVVGGLSRPPAAQAAAAYLAAPAPFNTEAYASLDENGWRRVSDHPLSTFSIDVDTASYANVRRFLNDGALPPAGAVRVEELINYFRFDYPEPSGEHPFTITTELAGSPWNPQHRLLLVGLQGRRLDAAAPPPRNLVFLADVSGSMAPPDKLPLVRQALRMLVDTLTPQDRIALVVYAGASGVVLPSTPGDRRTEIHAALARLEAGGSTNGAAGIQLAYHIARQHFVRGGINRVILATDGDFNVGTTSHDALVRLIEEERASGVFLSVLGVGTGNLKDHTMELLAGKGNGNYAYLDSLQEARKVLIREAGSTLVTIAKDVKLQVEFNPAAAAAYRLIGYENRVLRSEDFNDDRKDAGEMGAGHSVTALYEIVPPGVPIDLPAIDPLRYRQPARPAGPATELATVKTRYKAPDGDESRLVSAVVANRAAALTANLGFASAVAEFGMLLRGSAHRGSARFESALARAIAYRGADPDGDRAAFARLVDLAMGLDRLTVPPP